jgi:hypothetical protein
MFWKYFAVHIPTLKHGTCKNGAYYLLTPLIQWNKVFLRSLCHSVSEDIYHLLWKLKLYYRVHNIPHYHLSRPCYKPSHLIPSFI